MLLASLLLSLTPIPPAQESASEPRTAADWDRVALESGASFDTDAEMLAWLRALELEESDRRRRELGRLATTRERLRVTVRHDEARGLRELELNADGSLLSTRTSHGSLRMWDARTGVLLWEAEGFDPRFSENGRFLASVLGNTATLRNARTGRLVGEVHTAPETWINLALPDPTGRLLATIDRGEAQDHGDWLTLWDLHCGSPLAGPVPVGDCWFYDSTFDPTGKFFAACYSLDEGERFGIYLWSREDGLRSIDGTWPFAFDHDGERLAAGVREGAQLFSTATGEAISPPLPFGFCDKQLVFRDDGALVASDWAEVCIWDFDGGIARSAPRWRDDLDDGWREKYHTAPDDLSPDGTRCALGGLGDTLRIWDTETGVPIGPPLLHGMPAHHAAFARDDPAVATANEGGLVRVWDVAKSDRPTPPPAFVESRFEETADGAVVSRRESVVLLVELETGEIRELQRGGRVWGLAFDREGEGLAVSWENGEIDLWSPDGERIGDPLRQWDEAAVTWRGDRLVASGLLLRCWDLASGTTVHLGYGEWWPAVLTAGSELVYRDVYEDAWVISRRSLDSWRRLSIVSAPEDTALARLDPEGHRVACVGDGRVLLVDTRAGEVLAETKAEGVDSNTWVLFGSDGAGLLWLQSDYDEDPVQVRTWSPDSGAPPTQVTIDCSEESPLAWYADSRVLTWHAGSKLLAIARERVEPLEGDEIHLLDSESGAARGDPIVVPGEVTHLLLDSTGKRMALACGRQVDEVLPLSWADPPVDDPLEDVNRKRRVLARSPEGDLSAVIVPYRSLELWYTETEEPIARLSTHLSGLSVAVDPGVTHAAFDRTGTRLAVVHRDDSVTVWRLEDWRACGPPCRVGKNVKSLQFGGRSDRLVVLDEDGYSTYDVGSGERVAGPFGIHGSTVRPGPFDPSGNRLLVFDSVYVTLLEIEDGEVRPLGTRRRPRGNEIANPARFLDDGRVVVGVRMDKKPARLTILDFDDPGEVRLEGDATELRRIWEPRLGLRIEGDEIVRRQ